MIQPYAWANQIWLILDNGSSHTSAETLRFFAHRAQGSQRLRVLFTPPGASWLNLAESLLQAFSTRYGARGDWSSRLVMIDHLFAAQHEYNRLFAHPFAWCWTRQHFRTWLAGTPGLIRCNSSATDH